MTDYDASTSFLGEWGRFQKQVFYLLCLRAIPCGFIALSVVFLAATPHHHCLIPPQANLTPVWENSSIPMEGRSADGAPIRSRCSRYRLTDLRRFAERGLMPADVNWSAVATEGCLDGWQYDQSIYTSTVVSEVCGCVFTNVVLQTDLLLDGMDTFRCLLWFILFYSLKKRAQSSNKILDSNKIFHSFAHI